MKKAILVGLPLFLIVAGVLGAAYAGFIDIPGISPVAKIKASKDRPIDVAMAMLAMLDREAKKLPKPKPVVAKPVVQKAPPDAGKKKLAELWNEMDPAELAKITKDWKDPELAEVLALMDGEQVAKLMAALKTARAASLFRAIRTEADKQQALSPG